MDDRPAWASNVRLHGGSDIAFDSDRNGNLDVYVMKPDGTGLRRLTDHPRRDFDPAWSPDGSRIAFTSDRDGDREVYVMNADGSHQTRLTHSGGPTKHRRGRATSRGSTSQAAVKGVVTRTP